MLQLMTPTHRYTSHNVQTAEPVNEGCRAVMSGDVELLKQRRTIQYF